MELYIQELSSFVHAQPLLSGCMAFCLAVMLGDLIWTYVFGEFTMIYRARTGCGTLDHTYCFTVRRVKREYRCYIDRTPSMRGRDMSRYLPHYWIENGTNKHYICWTGKIAYPAQARTLCRRWSDATQQFIDTGRPAPGFENR